MRLCIVLCHLKRSLLWSHFLALSWPWSKPSSWLTSRLNLHGFPLLLQHLRKRLIFPDIFLQGLSILNGQRITAERKNALFANDWLLKAYLGRFGPSFGQLLNCSFRRSSWLLFYSYSYSIQFALSGSFLFFQIYCSWLFVKELSFNVKSLRLTLKFRLSQVVLELVPLLGLPSYDSFFFRWLQPLLDFGHMLGHLLWTCNELLLWPTSKGKFFVWIIIIF